MRHFRPVMKFIVCLLLLTVALAAGWWRGPAVSAAGEAAQNPKSQTPSSSQTPAAQEQEPRETVIIRRVRLPITVVDKKGQPVEGLTEGDFQIFEDKQPQQIESFADESAKQPIYLGVLMDTSASTAGKLKFEQDAAKDFIYTVVRVRKDKVAFVTFDDDVKLRQDFTDKLDLLNRSIDNVKKPGEHTALYDAIWQFCDEKMRGAVGRRALVIITDGEDTYSRATLREAIDIAQRTETIIFAISTKAGFSGTVPGVTAGTVSDKSDRELERLCDETGGKAFFTGDLLALERSFTKIANELRSQYVVTYKPTNDRYDGQFRRIEVKLASSHNGAKVRTRRGYTAVADSVR